MSASTTIEAIANELTMPYARMLLSIVSWFRPICNNIERQ